MNELTKACTKCGKEYPATREYFCKCKGGKYGLHPHCKACRHTVADQYISIYALVDPRNNKPFYVGQTNNPTYRLSVHVMERGNSQWNHAKARLVYEIVESGLRPQMDILERTTHDQASKAEAQWIAALRMQGAKLLNVAPAETWYRKSPKK